MPVSRKVNSLVASVAVAAATATLIAATGPASARRQDPNAPAAGRPGGDANIATDKPSEKRGRWGIRNGMDVEAKKVVKKPTPTTFGALGALPRPGGTLPKDKRMGRAETTLWTVEARLVSYDLRADGDYHLVLKDKTGRTLVAELPDPHIVAASPFAREIGAARRAFSLRFFSKNDAELGRVYPGTGTPVRVTGLGYFGKAQKPGLPNGVRIHPVTGITVH